MYRWIETNKIVQRLADGASIPADPANTDFQAVLEWVAEGNTIEAAPPPVVPPHAARHAELKTAIQANGLIERLRNATPTQIDTFVQGRIAILLTEINAATNLAQAKVALASVANELGALAKALGKVSAYLLRGNED